MGIESDHFNLLAGNGEPILHSEIYNSKAAAINGAESVISNSGDETKYEHKTSGENCYFILKAGNGQTIGTSEMYISDDACKNGAMSVMNNGPIAEIVDATY